MGGKDWIFISDAHLSGNDSNEIKRFVSFLKSEREKLDSLIVLGDLFEFFFGFKPSIWNKKSYLFPDYKPIFEEFQNLYERGIKIKYFEGNHDFSLNSFFSRQLDIEVEVYPDGSEEILGGKRTFIAHGDLSNPNDYRYRIFRLALKNRLTYGFIQILGPNISCRIAKILSKRSYRKFHEEVKYESHPSFKKFAKKKFLEGYEIVILGHSHYPEWIEEIIEGKRFIYFNVGDWMTHRSFLRYSPPDKFFLSRWEDG
jgi:UDP-2,3-diacylglucosamine hydrolase